MTKYEIAAILEEIAFLLELKGENPFKATAYSRAAEILKTLVEEPVALVAERRFGEGKGSGPPPAPPGQELVTGGSPPLPVGLLGAFSRGRLGLARASRPRPRKTKMIH